MSTSSSNGKPYVSIYRGDQDYEANKFPCGMPIRFCNSPTLPSFSLASPIGSSNACRSLVKRLPAPGRDKAGQRVGDTPLSPSKPRSIRVVYPRYTLGRVQLDTWLFIHQGR